MPRDYDEIKQLLTQSPRTWVITGVAGFIGSNLLETLLKLNQKVIGLDNFSTGFRKNLKEVEGLVSEIQWGNFEFLEGDICNLDDCLSSCKEADYVLHQAALGSVPRSIEDPIATNQSNIDGFLNMLVAARDCKTKRFVFAASSSTYGDHEALPKVESVIGNPLSPYAVTKYVNELYASVFARSYNIESIGLRYFNVFGRRQDPEGAYAAVIPKWFASMLDGKPVYINGDGETSRDFCYIDNAVQANILAAMVEAPEAVNQVYNVAFSNRTTLNELFLIVRELVSKHNAGAEFFEPEYRDFRPGDVRHSLADIDKAKKLLGYDPQTSVRAGLEIASKWYCDNVAGIQDNR